MREQEAKAREQKEYQLLSNQQIKKKQQQQCTKNPKMSGALVPRTEKKVSDLDRECIETRKGSTYSHQNR
ncbi:hypothetical protein [Companilactobacillus furfuricola]|uniref:hypothetical protein n=1 Tax=Companilactobacillus furfuricola TaxID=1462575 RepID=UPI000F78A5D6|nr:hypothetical protein [Companilactobacillus furfuricola]